jgi:hypothetical protein
VPGECLCVGGYWPYLALAAKPKGWVCAYRLGISKGGLGLSQAGFPSWVPLLLETLFPSCC